MGLLDDAIREHLDLKRRRGADPAEVERAEQEALGPVRRGPIEADPPELVLDEAHQPVWDERYEDELDEPAAGESGAAVSFSEPQVPLEPPAGLAPEPFEEDPFGDEPGPPPTLAGQHDDEPDLARPAEHYDEPDATQVREPLEETPPAPHRAPLPREQFGETVEYDVGEALGEGTGGAGEHVRPSAPKPAEGTEEDPLEETPEFLQETPDHDRLWFEQRPPRDFDFDG